VVRSGWDEPRHPPCNDRRNKTAFSRQFAFQNVLNCLWPVLRGLRNWLIPEATWTCLPSGDNEKQAQLSLRSVVNSDERKGKLKYYVSKSATTWPSGHRRYLTRAEWTTLSAFSTHFEVLVSRKYLIW